MPEWSAATGGIPVCQLIGCAIAHIRINVLGVRCGVYRYYFA